MLDREVIEYLRGMYPNGARVRLARLDDPYVSIPTGSLGTVRTVDDIGTIHVEWDNGLHLGCVFGEDIVEKVV